MTTWIPLKLREDSKTERHPQYKGRLRVTLGLEPRPDDAWREYFNQPFPPNVPISMSRKRPRCGFEGIVMEPLDRDDEMADYYQDVRERLDATNEWYETTYLPAVERAAAQERAAEEAERGRLSAAQARLKKLMKP